MKAIDGKTEKLIVTGMVVSTDFLRDITPILRTLKTPFAKEVAKWCTEYYEQYQKAPNRHIEDIFNSNRSSLTKESEELTEMFLGVISDEYEDNGGGFNTEYALDRAEKYFRSLSLEDVKSKLSSNLMSGRVDAAEELLKSFNRVARPSTTGVNPFDPKVIERAFSETSGNTLLQLPGDLGKATGKWEREHLIAFLGKTNIGKTWWLMWVSMLGLWDGRKVLFISLEMSETQLVKRINHHILGLPTKHYDELLIPVFDCVKNQEGSCERTERRSKVALEEEDTYQESAAKGYKPCTACTRDYDPDTWHKEVKRDVLTEEAILIRNRELIKTGLLKPSRFKFIKFPQGKATMQDLETTLNNMENYDGFVPDIIVTDYADKFRSSHKREGVRHELNDVWEEHKSLAQERKCLVVTASQSNTLRTGKDIKEGDWAESVGKANIVDISIALNQTKEEKAKGLLRASVLKERDEDFDSSGEVFTLTSYRIGTPYLDSYLRRGRHR